MSDAHVSDVRHHAVPVAKPVDISGAKALAWLVGSAFVALAIYYFVGVDEGASSVFGKTMMIHEFVHDGRHFLGFPCH